jgi:SRSO17 transposase
VRRDFRVTLARRAAEPSQRAEEVLWALPVRTWRTLHWHEGSRGWLQARFAAQRCWRVDGQGNLRIGWLIGQRSASDQDREEEWKYCWSDFGPQASLEQMVEYGHRRYWVEQYREEAKGLLGWDKYQGRRWKGFHRHAVTVMLAYSFLVWKEWRERQTQRRRGRPRRPFSPSARPASAIARRDPSPDRRLAT